AETVAMYDPSIPVMWANHHAFLSAGGLTNFTMSSPERTMPSMPKTTGTMPSRCQLAPGRTSPSTTSAALTANVTRAAAQSRARVLPLARSLASQHAIARERHVEAEDREQREEDLRTPEREHDRGRRDHGHRPEVDSAPAAMSPSAFHREHRERRQAEGEHPG